METREDIAEGNARIGFWISVFATFFIGALSGLILFLLFDIEENPLSFIVATPVILGYIGGSVWYHGLNFRDMLGYYPWEKKLLSDEELEDW